MSKILRVHQVAEQLGVLTSSVRLYVKNNQLECSHTPSGQRIFTQEQVDKFTGKEQALKRVFYTRSSTGDKKLLDTQYDLLVNEYGEPLKVYSDKSSGLNENRRGLAKLIKHAEDGDYTQVCVTNKDRLARFGFTYIENHLKSLGVSIVTLDDVSDDKSIYDELLQDFMSLIASFSGKFYRLRGYEQKKKLLGKAGEELDKNHQ